MNPAWSVILLTTLIGAGQGLFLALWAADGLLGASEREGGRALLVLGGLLALGLMAAGLMASFFHLGRPERAWRAAAQWRSSWLSREVIALPLFMAGLALWVLVKLRAAPPGADALPAGWWLGLGVALLCALLFVCTAMIYASVRFLQEWASAYTLVNLLLLGLASGAVLASALAAALAPSLLRPLGVAALLLTLAGGITRGLSLRRNARLKPKSSLQTAIGIRHPQIRQRAQGFMGGSFNTQEFFHGRSPGALRQVKGFFLLAAFVLPALLLGLGLASGALPWLVLASVVQSVGLLAERWFFFAQANHPQNLYYQAVS
ncbi:MAG: dimethyl sulfoxide reductase anchor subunit [Rubrivivax sp.]|nr:dimethyl sulfoxide reductase anchor subunit [Rubrivivax sp.]